MKEPKTKLEQIELETKIEHIELPQDFFDGPMSNLAMTMVDELSRREYAFKIEVEKNKPMKIHSYTPKK